MSIEIKLPDPRCASICRLRLSERCIDRCAPQGEGAYFEVDPKLKLHEMPNYPDTDDLKPRLQFKIEKAYTRKMFEHLTGKENEHKPIIRRPHTNSQASGGVPSDQQSQDLLHASETAVTLFEAGEECPGETVGPTEVARKSD